MITNLIIIRTLRQWQLEMCGRKMENKIL